MSLRQPTPVRFVQHSAVVLLGLVLRLDYPVLPEATSAARNRPAPAVIAECHDGGASVCAHVYHRMLDVCCMSELLLSSALVPNAAPARGPPRSRLAPSRPGCVYSIYHCSMLEYTMNPNTSNSRPVATFLTRLEKKSVGE